MRHCTIRQIIPQQQFVFRAKSSCKLALFAALHVDTWMNAIDECKMVGALLIDLSKALDSVPFQKLLLKLQNLMFHGHSIAL